MEFDIVKHRFFGMLERRLLETFESDETSNFRSEALPRGEGRAPSSGARGRGEIDVERLRATQSYLRLISDDLDSDAGELSELRGAAEAVDSIIANGPVIRNVREAFRAELLIVADGTRPAALVRDGGLLQPGALGDFGELYQLSKATVEVSLRAAGRIDSAGAQLGSGMLVTVEGEEGPLVLTAGHVVEPWLDPADRNRLRPGCTIDFGAEIGSSGSNSHRLDGVVACRVDDKLGEDYALISLGARTDRGSLPAPANIALASWRLEARQTIGVLGFPAKPATRAGGSLPAIWQRLAGGAWNVKRLSPGIIRKAPEDGKSVALVWHDATTTGGSSGSGILTFGSGYLSGIHAGGRTEANRGMSLAAIAASSDRKFG